MSLFGGYAGALFFTCLITALGNLENIIFGKSYQMKLFPEGKMHTYYFTLDKLRFMFSVLTCFVTGLALAASIHRVCFTTW